MKITAKQVETVEALAGPERYEHFIKVAADQRKVWGLYHDGWALAATNALQPVFPIWPAREYALRCASSEWSEYEPREIDLDDLFQVLLPLLRKKGTQLGVFYTTKDKGVITELGQIEADLKLELAKIE
jgi:Protein of unknown function (DUF2750)